MQRLRVPLDDLRVVGGTLRALRIEAGLTQQAVAERARISAYWYRKIEKHGQQPSRPVAEDIAAALGCTLNDITVRIDSKAAA